MSEMKALIKRVQGKVFPRSIASLKTANETIRMFVIGDYAPATPPIPPNTPIACIGSCFAEEMSKSLAAQGKSVIPLFLSERWNTAFAVRGFLENTIDHKPFPEDFLSSFKTDENAAPLLAQAGAYIITLGLSVCWFNRSTNRMVLDVKFGHTFDGLANTVNTHTMRQTSVAENVEQIEAIVACIRRASPSAPIIFTLSPVPLFFSSTDHPPIPSNTISKSTLRVALHEISERHYENVFYWPSYEIVEWYGKYVRILWGQDGNDLRHLQPDVVDDIMRRFAELYFSA